MKPGRQFIVVFVTAPDLKTARKLAKAALQARLAACVNLVPNLESHFWWQGKTETATEVLMLFKTTTPRVAALERQILAQHPYDTPELVALPVTSGTKRYLDWWRTSIKS